MARGIDGGIRWLGINACPRCGGLLVAEPSLDLAVEGLEAQGPTEVPAKRCVQCGEVIDAVILRNRRTVQAQPDAEETSHSALSTEERS